MLLAKKLFSAAVILPFSNVAVTASGVITFNGEVVGPVASATPECVLGGATNGALASGPQKNLMTSETVVAGEQARPGTVELQANPQRSNSLAISAALESFTPPNDDNVANYDTQTWMVLSNPRGLHAPVKRGEKVKHFTVEKTPPGTPRSTGAVQVHFEAKRKDGLGRIPVGFYRAVVVVTCEPSD